MGGSLRRGVFELHAAPNGGPVSHFNEAVSRQVLWSDQAEVDHCWARLGEGGAPQGQQIAMATAAGGALEILLS
ncbi:VOC family protein [Aquipseudomonas alcaligenes]|uniref:VOC family protein n=1 Tax=Aquipseudomonas alcaligenes TaxID=43263 RepID=UPI001C81519E